MRRLDTLLPELVSTADARIFLKSDAQGSDLEVLRGANGSLARIAAVQTEVPIKTIYEGMPSYTQVLGFLERHGFELTGVFPVTRDQELRVLELDCILVRAGSRDGSR